MVACEQGFEVLLVVKSQDSEMKCEGEIKPLGQMKGPACGVRATVRRSQAQRGEPKPSLALACDKGRRPASFRVEWESHEQAAMQGSGGGGE